MTSRAVARQYALALFDVAQKGRQTDRVGRELSEFVSLVRSHEELARVFANAAIPPAQKRAIVTELVRSLPGLSPEFIRFVDLLAQRDRLMLVGAMEEVFREKALEASGVVRAELVTAAPLDDGARADIAAALRQTLGRDVTMAERVDGSIVGGFVAKVGSVVFDASIGRHLERIREKLLREA